MSWKKKGFGDNVQTKGGFLNCQHNVVFSSRDRIRRVGFQDGSMVENFVMGLKTSPNHIGLVSALETADWQFIDQHGPMRRLNQVNLSGFHRSQAKGKVFFGKKYVVVNVNHPLVGIFEQSIWISQQAFGCFPHITSLGLNSLTCFASMTARLKLSNHVFFDANGLYKREQTPVWRWALGR
ncbi:uncharacterized protein TNCV_1079711 [Trichonephila clavipes]|nr:uncharacterized protein TNCV_1079711 [Trichonephila clavipes]